MCGRYVLLRADIRELMRRLHLEELYSLAVKDTRFNIGPGQRILTVHQRENSQERVVKELNWGWRVPSHDAPGRTQFLVNARGETLSQRPTFREAFKQRRCVVPASGYYEWKRDRARPEPWLFRLKNDEPFYIAGLWEAAPDGSASCLLITTGPNEVMKPIHDRMPAILSATQAEQWLSPLPGTKHEAGALLRPYPAEEMVARRVSEYVNNIRNEGEACWSPPSQAAGPVVEQLDFGL